MRIAWPFVSMAILFAIAQWARGGASNPLGTATNPMPTNSPSPATSVSAGAFAYSSTNLVVLKPWSEPKATTNWPGIISAASAIVSLVIAGILCRVAVQQHQLARAVAAQQKALAEQQHALASQQHTLAQEKLKLDLFEKRFSVYKSAQRGIISVFKTFRVKAEDAIRFAHDTQDDVFLFGPEVHGRLESVYEKIAELSAVQMQYDELPTPELRRRIQEKEQALKDQLNGELKHLTELFGPYLKFKP